MTAERTGPVVLGYDGSAGATAALAEAVTVARAFGVSLVVVFAYGQNPVGGVTGDVRRAVERVGGDLLEDAAARIRAIDAMVTVDRVEVDADPVVGLVAVARERDARMIVVGGNTVGPVVGTIVRARSYRLIHESPVPVLVVRPEA